MTRKILGILGPTATGKTSLGVALAARFAGEIVSIDSRQIYTGLDIGTGKDLDAYKAPHDVAYHLIDIISPKEMTYPISLAQWLRRARAVIAQLHGSSSLPVLVGGTHQYWWALIEDFEPPEVAPDRPFRMAAERIHESQLAAELESRFPKLAAATSIENKRRIIRALEVGKHMGDHSLKRSRGVSERYDPYLIAVQMERRALLERIRTRLEQRLQEGLVEEVKGLLSAGVERQFLIRLGLEYGFVCRHLEGELSYEQLVEGLHRAICRFAKAQETWVRGLEKKGWEMVRFRAGEDPQSLHPGIERWLAARSG